MPLPRDPNLPPEPSARDWHTVINGTGVQSVCTRLALAGVSIYSPDLDERTPRAPKGSMNCHHRLTGEFLGNFTIEDAMEKFLNGDPIVKPFPKGWRPESEAAGAEGDAPRHTRSPVGRSALAPPARPIIWAHADKVWEEAGKPMDKDTVLELRKRMMTELEAQGIKKTTSSTALGDWMKKRLG